MRRALVAAVVTLLAGTMAVPATSRDARQSVKFVTVASGTTTVDGAKVRLLLDLANDPDTGGGTTGFGKGAASLVVKPAKSGRTARGRFFYRSGVLTARLKYKTGAPDYIGIREITGSGKLLGGSRAFKNAKGKIEVTGTQSSDGLIKLTFTGSGQFGVAPPTQAPAGSGRGH